MTSLIATDRVSLGELEKAPPDLLQYLTQRVTEEFYRSVHSHLLNVPGGILLGQPRLKVVDDAAGLWGREAKIVVSAECLDLPTPPEARLLGGPADGTIIRAHGRSVRIPYVADFGSSSYAEPVRAHMSVAVYEQQGDTSLFMYSRTEEM